MSAITARLSLRKAHKAERGKLTKREFLKTQSFRLTYGHVGGLLGIGGYYFLTQLLRGQLVKTTVLGDHVRFHLWNVKGRWDHLLDADTAHGGLVKWLSHAHWTTYRHLVRPLEEGVYGGLLYFLVTVNPVRLMEKRPENPSWFTRQEMRSRVIATLYQPVTVAQMVFVPVAIALYQIPGVGAGYVFDWLLRKALHTQSLAPTLSAHPSLAAKFYTGAFDAKVIGLFAALFWARRPAKPVANFILRFFGMRRALKAKKCHIYHSVGFKKVVDEYREMPCDELERLIGYHGRMISASVPLACLFVAGLAGLGYWVITTFGV